MRNVERRKKVLVLCLLIVIAFTVVFVLLPLKRAELTCFGGSACVDRFSLSCQVFGFGTYTNYYGRYHITSDCTSFVKSLL